MLSELHNLNLKLCSKQYSKSFVLHLIGVPQLSSGWQHSYSTKTRQAGRANEQSMYSLMSMVSCHFEEEALAAGRKPFRLADTPVGPAYLVLCLLRALTLQSGFFTN
jgi:hypothetical protein